MCDCNVENVLSVPFSAKSFEQKQAIIQTGRPTPNLKDLVKGTGKVIRRFKESWYEEYKWLCGCLKTNKLYC